jgi:hypothetical protein
MEESSISFHGNGDRAVPAAPPMTNDKKLLLSTFIYFPLTLNTRQTLQSFTRS